MKRKKKARKKKKKTRKINKKKRFKKRSLRRRRIGKSKKRQKKKVKQLTRRKKVRSKKAKRRKNFFKKARTSGFKKSIKKRFKFSFSLRELLKKIVSPIVNYQKKRQLLKSKKIKEEEKRKKKEIRAQSDLRKELLKKEIREEKVIARTRKIELHNFLREEQKNIREKEKEKNNKFLEEIKLEKTLEKFRARELDEIKNLERFVLSVEKSEYKDLQLRIDQVRQKYKTLRNERLRKRVEELGVTLSNQDTIWEIRRKEKEYLERRELISVNLESFRRSASSLIYQISKRYLPKNADLLRVVDRVYEESEIIIKEDQAPLSEYLVLIYLKNQDFEKDLIVVEDKITQNTRRYHKSEIFKFGDELTDSMIKYLEKLREGIKKAS